SVAVASITTNHGTITGTGPSYIYTPAATYVGTDTFVVTANDGHGGVVSRTVHTTSRRPMAPWATTRYSSATPMVTSPATCCSPAPRWAAPPAWSRSAACATPSAVSSVEPPLPSSRARR